MQLMTRSSIRRRVWLALATCMLLAVPAAAEAAPAAPAALPTVLAAPTTDGLPAASGAAAASLAGLPTVPAAVRAADGAPVLVSDTSGADAGDSTGDHAETPTLDDRKKAEKKDEGSAASDDNGEKAGEKPDDKKKKKKTFDEIVKDTVAVEGLFNFYRQDDEKKLYMEIAPDQFDKVFLVNPTLESGTGEGFFLAAAMLTEFPMEMKRVGDNVHFVVKNVWFRADEKKPIHRAVAKGFSDSVLAVAKIEGEAHPERKSVLVDVGPIFLGDLLGIGSALKAIYRTGYGLDKDATVFGAVRSFPKNAELESLSVFRTGDPKQSFTLPDARAMTLGLRYSISSLEENGYRPRLADDRVGHFLTLFQDYSSDIEDEADVRYINRWHLEKKDPLLEVSEPKEPIVFWIENSVPEEYREAVKEGVLLWNAAFEKAGFKEAIQVKVQPDDADWDAADVRYNTLRWIVAPGATFAQGPSRANPYTGQIYDADIRFGSDMMRFTRREYAEEVKPVALNGRGIEPLYASGQAPAGPGGLIRLDPGRFCNYADGAAREASFGWDLMAARGVLDKDGPDARKYLRDFIVHVTAHEVGHTLGLRHNFKASSVHKVSELNDLSVTEPLGLTGSVMDYTPVNLAPEGVKQGQYWQTTLGPYDYWAIEYAYRTIDADSPAGELPELEKIASRAAEPMLAYATDEDTYGFSTRSVDPTANLWDIGDDPIAYYTGRVQNARELLGKIEPTFEKPGMQYQKLREVFTRGVVEFQLAGLNVSKYIGGMYYNRDHVGDAGGRAPFEPVPAAKQRQALAFLTENVFGPKAPQVTASLMNRMAPERMPDIFGSSYNIMRLDYPIHATMLNVQSAPLDRIFDPLTLQRLADIEKHYEKGSDPMTMSEVFTGVREAIWAELPARRDIDSFRRNLQRRHLDYMIYLVIQPTAGVPEDARTLARADLIDISKGIDAVLKTPAGLDRITKAHLEETRSRIEAVLNAEVERSVFPRLVIGLG